MVIKSRKTRVVLRVLSVMIIILFLLLVYLNFRGTQDLSPQLASSDALDLSPSVLSGLVIAVLTVVLIFLVFIIYIASHEDF